MTMQNLDEARHVRALEIVRQVHVHVEVGDRVLLAARPILDLYRMINVLDAHLVDGYLARVGMSLDILHGLNGRFFGGDGGVHIHFLLKRSGPDGAETAELKNFRPFDVSWL